MKKIGLFIVILLSFAYCKQVKAAFMCTDEENEKFQKFANNITYTLDPVIDENNNATFNLTFSGVYSGLRISLDVNGIDYANYFTTSGETISQLTLNKLQPGKKYLFKIHGKLRCYSNTFRTFTINLPIYNQYYNSNICSDAKEYSLCQKWINVSVDYNSLEKMVTDYKNSRKNNNEIVNPTNNENWLSALYNKYYWYFLIGLIVIFIVLIYFWTREQKKNQL